jgi:multiple sugar transport system permease protein
MFRDATAESNWGPMFAMSIVTLLPPLIVFLSMQKYFVQGISTSGLKG